MNYLEQIIETKKSEVEKLDSLDNYKRKVKENTRTDIRKIEWTNNLDVIAEIKRKSPSKGELAQIVDPCALAKKYEQGGAALVSVLTDEEYFGAKTDDLANVRNSIKLPVLRKDFIVDERQIFQSYLMGADAILLIIDAIGNEKLAIFYKLAKSLGLEVLVEAHDSSQYKYANEIIGANLIGINTRDLKTFKEDTQAMKYILLNRNKDIVNVWESGISTISDAQVANEYGADALLIGQALVQSGNSIKFIKDIRHI